MEDLEPYIFDPKNPEKRGIAGLLRKVQKDEDFDLLIDHFWVCELFDDFVFDNLTLSNFLNPPDNLKQLSGMDKARLYIKDFGEYALFELLKTKDLYQDRLNLRFNLFIPRPHNGNDGNFARVPNNSFSLLCSKFIYENTKHSYERNIISGTAKNIVMININDNPYLPKKILVMVEEDFILETFLNSSSTKTIKMVYLICSREFAQRNTSVFHDNFRFVVLSNTKDIHSLIAFSKREASIKDNRSLVHEPFKLSSLRLENLGHFPNLSFDFGERLTVLVGENGSGKSTVLKALALALTGTKFFDADRDLIEQKQKILSHLLKINNYEGSQPVYAEQGNLWLQISNDKELGLSFVPSTLLSGKVNETDQTPEARTAILHQETQFRTVILGFSQGGEAISPEFMQKNGVPSVLDLLPIISGRSYPVLDSLSEWIYYYIHEREDPRPVETLFEVISNISGGEVYLKRPYESCGAVGSPSGEKAIVVCTPDAPQGIHLDLVSQGYQNIFRWVGGILMKLYAAADQFGYDSAPETLPAIVLIDEIDTYLHPKWQQTLPRVLLETFPETQFVITTHSPVMLVSLNPHEIPFRAYQIRKDGGKLEAFDFGRLNLYAMDTDAALKNELLFDFPTYPQEIANQVGEYENLLQQLQNNQTHENGLLFEQVEKLHSSLSQILDETHPLLLRGQYFIKLKKKQYADYIKG